MGDNKAWEPEVGERYWFIGSAGDTERLVVMGFIRGRDDCPESYSARKRDHNIFRTRAQARKTLQAIKDVLGFYSEIYNEERKAR